MKCYPNDPYLSFWNQWPSGELMTEGMAQAMNLGLVFKKRYIDTLKFMSPNYRNSDIYIQSCGMPRCLQSAASFFAGFYSQSNGTYPQNLTTWPTNWSPVAIFSEPISEDKLLENDANCPRAVELFNERANDPEYKQWVNNSNADLIRKIYANSGIMPNDTDGFNFFFDCIAIENDPFNFTFPDWLDEKTFNESEEFIETAADFVTGGSGFGQPVSDEMSRLRAGNLLKTWIANMQQMMTGKDNTYKVYSYCGV
ncbi:hypothetical protein WR25_19102 [Diploscapter pachys]|uniref:Uncharacterized protein n=1 Tax=Diploscapter pachys TaxID=2018661 RepID=A0A2A2LNV5_9BILA|nr:hypothetical protein WR25_19102 [Diploscapter pachys]